MSPLTSSHPLASILRRHQMYIHHRSSKATNPLSNCLYTPLPSGDRTAGVPGSGPGLTHVGVHLGSPPAECVALGKVPSATGPQFPQLQNRDSPFCSLTGRLSRLNGATHLKLFVLFSESSSTAQRGWQPSLGHGVLQWPSRAQAGDFPGGPAVRTQRFHC